MAVATARAALLALVGRRRSAAVAAAAAHLRPPGSLGLELEHPFPIRSRSRAGERTPRHHPMRTISNDVTGLTGMVPNSK